MPFVDIFFFSVIGHFAEHYVYIYLDPCNLHRIAIRYCNVTLRYTATHSAESLEGRAWCDVYTYNVTCIHICIYTHTWCTRDGARAVSISRAPIIFLLRRLPPGCRGWSPGRPGAADDGEGVRWEARGRCPTRSKYGDIKPIKRANSRHCIKVCVHIHIYATLAWLPLNFALLFLPGRLKMIFNS